MANASSSLLEFVLRQMHVKTNHTSRQKWKKGDVLQLRTVPDYNLIYVAQGEVVWEIDQTPYHLKSGSLVIVPPATPHRGYSRSHAATFLSVHLELSLPGGQDVFDLLAPARRQQVATGSRLESYLCGALAEFDRPTKAQAWLMLPGWGHLIAFELLRTNAEQGLLRYRAINPIVAEVLDELSRRIKQPTDLATVARHAGFSPQHLNRLFHRELGVTPLKYLMRMRLERAAGLLAEGRLTINAIARQLGFEDAGYFGRLFKQQFGQLPSRYRDSFGSSKFPNQCSASPTSLAVNPLSYQSS